TGSATPPTPCNRCSTAASTRSSSACASPRRRKERREGSLDDSLSAPLDLEVSPGERIARAASRCRAAPGGRAGLEASRPVPAVRPTAFAGGAGGVQAVAAQACAPRTLAVHWWARRFQEPDPRG